MNFTQMPLFPPKANWKPTPVSHLPSWADAKRIGIDCETCDPQLKTLGPGPRRGGFVAGVSFKIEDGPGFYLPIRHQHGENLDVAQVTQYLRDQAKVFRGDLCGLSLPYDLDYLKTDLDVWFTPRFFRDAGIADPLLDELQWSYGLDAIAKRWGFPSKKEDQLKIAANAWGLNPKSDMWKLPSAYVAEYAIYDAELPLLLLRKQERQMEEQELWGVWNLESRLLPVLTKMRMRGVRIDFDKLDQLDARYLAEERQSCAQMKRASGYQLDPEDLENPGAIAKLLESLGYTAKDVGLTKGRKNKKTGKRTGKKLKTDAETLKGLDHPVLHMLKRAKRFHKLRCTFVASIRRYETNGRIHGTFKQVRGETDFGDTDKGAKFGRTAALDPNLQQQPNPEKDPEIAGEFRQVYIPDEGKLWACCDFSQQEPRMLVHYAERKGLAMRERGKEPRWLAKAIEAANRYRTDPDVDNHQMIADMCGIERKPAKDILLGKMYGMGGGKLCLKLELPTVERVIKRDWGNMKRGDKYLAAGPEGKAIIDQFDERLPFVVAIAEICQQIASVRGWIRTLSGRKCRFPLDSMGRYDFTHKALNRLVQGGAGDQMKKSLVDMDDAGYEPQLVVHDEADLSVSSREEALAIGKIMTDSYEMRVPFKVDVEIGSSWGKMS